MITSYALTALLFTLPISASNIAALLGGSPPAAGACATSDTAIAHDELLEGFQTATTGYENTWSEVGTTANITEAADSTALSTGKPTGACNQAFKIVVPTDGAETYAQWDRGSEINPNSQAVNIVYYMYIETAPDNAESFYTFAFGSTTNPANVCVRVTVGKTGANVTLTAVGTSASNAVTVSTGQWIKVALHVDTTTTGNLSTMTINDGTPEGFNRNTVGIRYFFMGSTSSLDANDSGTLWFDLLCVNSP